MSYFCCHRFYNNTKHNKKMADCAMDIEAIEIDGDLIPCHVCGRTFLSAPLKKHIKICEKNASKKRRVFDSSKQRVEGTELAPFHQSVKKPNSDTKTEIIKTNWKEKHEKLVEAIRAAKSNKPPTANMAPRRSISASGTMGYTSRCPSCDRQFGPKAFDRHVEWCKEHKSRPTNSPANVQLAKERLEARTKYKVPPLNKSKRYQTREKYKPNLRNDSQVSLEKIETERKKSEPIIKKKQEVQDKLIKEKSKSVILKTITRPQINTSNINDSVIGMTVRQVDLSHRKVPLCHNMKLDDSYNNINLNLRKNDDKSIKILKEPSDNFDADSLYDSESILNLNTARQDNNDLSDSERIKSKSETNSELFSNCLQTKYTSTPLEKNKFVDITSGSLIYRREDNFSYETSSIIDLTNLKCEEPQKALVFDDENDFPSIVVPTVDKIKVEENVIKIEREFSKKLKIISDSYDLINENYSSPQMSSTSIKEDKLPVIINTNEEKIPIVAKKNCTLKDLQELFEKISSRCQIQLEIIATETEPVKDQISPDFKLTRENSKEIIIQGENSQKIINQLLKQNDIKSVNVVFINEDIPKSPKQFETVPETSSHVSVKVMKMKKNLKCKKRLINRKKCLEKVEKFKLPLIRDLNRKESLHIDTFWKKELETNIQPSIQQKAMHNYNLKFEKNIKTDLPEPEPEPEFPPVSFLPPIIKNKPIESTTNNKVNYNPFLVAEKQLLDLLNDDTPSPSSTITKTPNTPLKSIKNPPKIFQKHPPKRISVIEPPQDFSDKLNVLQDNFELIENFINDNFDKNVILTHRKYSDDNTTIDPSLINEIDNLDLPEKIYDENLSPISINHNLEGQNITKRSQSVQNNHQALDEIDLEQLISSFDDDDTFPTLKTFLQTKNPEKIQKSTTSLNSSCGIDNKSLTSLKRSVSLQNPAIKARSLVKKQDITDYLHEKVPKNNPNIVKPAKNFDELFPENHELYDEYKRFEEEYKRDIKMASGDESSNDESRLPRKTINKGKLSGDSAYGSLNRKLSVPKRGVSIERSSSSSGSETPMKAKISNNKLSKYCHECGFKYPVDSAKFCVECGIKRLVL